MHIYREYLQFFQKLCVEVVNTLMFKLDLFLYIFYIILFKR